MLPPLRDVRADVQGEAALLQMLPRGPIHRAHLWAGVVGGAPRAVMAAGRAHAVTYIFRTGSVAVFAEPALRARFFPDAGGREMVTGLPEPLPAAPLRAGAYVWRESGCQGSVTDLSPSRMAFSVSSTSPHPERVT